jgi:acyl-coenzyme A synthetase/AMP-(fatty) acid ligase
MMWEDWYGLTADDRLLHAGAFNWTYTLGTGLMDPWAIGATALIPDPGLDRATLAQLIRDSRATIFAASPGVYRQLVKSGAPLDMPDLRHGLSAGEKLPAALEQAWEAATGKPIFEALGMSEVSTFISSSPAAPVHPGSSGRPQLGRRIAVLNPDGHQPQPVNTPGILAVSKRDPGLMLGYRHAPEETANRFQGEWFLTGDTVQMDENGYITYLGRDDDMMNAGGYRVSPIELETALNSHPDIAESAATAVEIKPDTFVIAAFYQSAVPLADADLAAFCAARLARYKCPRLFIRLDALPKGANNKLKRGDLRAGFRKQT